MGQIGGDSNVDITASRSTVNRVLTLYRFMERFGRVCRLPPTLFVLILSASMTAVGDNHGDIPFIRRDTKFLNLRGS